MTSGTDSPRTQSHSLTPVARLLSLCRRHDLSLALLAVQIKNLSALSFTMTSLTLEGDGFLLSPSPLTGAKLYGRRLRVVGCLQHATDDNRQGRYVTNLPNTYSDIFLVQSLPRLDAPTPLIADGIMCGEWNRLASWSAAACMPAVTTVESRDLLQIEG